jgi:hypothetical protein
MGVPLVLAGLGAAGTAISAAGSVESGNAAQTAYNYQAQVAANNAKIAQQNAAWDIQAGETAATNKGLQTRAAVGTQKARQGASGIDVNTGSAPDVRAGTEELGMLDALTIRSNAAKQAYGAEVEATSDTAQSQLDTMAGQQAKEAGDINAASGLLTGASTVGGNYVKWQTQFGSSGGGS